jgi:hypothetical protein
MVGQSWTQRLEAQCRCRLALPWSCQKVLCQAPQRDELL